MISIGLGLYRGVQLQELFLSAVAFAVAAIPTALPAVTTAILSKGSQQLAAAGAIMKRLRSVETLGSTSALNSDKTGTLTLNQMTAVQMADRRAAATRSAATATRRSARSPTPAASRTSRSSSTCCRWPCAPTPRSATARSSGDPTEGALVVLAAKGGVDPTLTREQYPRVATLPFDAAYKMMATFHA